MLAIAEFGQNLLLRKIYTFIYISLPNSTMQLAFDVLKLNRGSHVQRRQFGPSRPYYVYLAIEIESVSFFCVRFSYLRACFCELLKVLAGALVC